LAEQRARPASVEVAKVVSEIDSHVFRYEDLVWRLLNFDQSVLAQTEKTLKVEKRRKLNEIAFESLLVPHVYVVSAETFLYVIGLRLVKAKHAVLNVVEDQDERTYVEFGSVFYPLSEANIETSLLLVMNADIVPDKVWRHIGVPPAELRDYIGRAIAESGSLYSNLKQIPVEKLTELSFSGGYRTFVMLENAENGSKISFEYYSIDAALWSYYGVNGLYVTDAKRFENLVSKRKDVVDDLLVLRDVMSRIETYVAAAYLLTKMIENILP